MGFKSLRIQSQNHFSVLYVKLIMDTFIKVYSRFHRSGSSQRSRLLGRLRRLKGDPRALQGGRKLKKSSLTLNVLCHLYQMNFDSA